jgi:hypothetical protein
MSCSSLVSRASALAGPSLVQLECQWRNLIHSWRKRGNRRRIQGSSSENIASPRRKETLFLHGRVRRENRERGRSRESGPTASPMRWRRSPRRLSVPAPQRRKPRISSACKASGIDRAMPPIRFRFGLSSTPFESERGFTGIGWNADLRVVEPTMKDGGCELS